MTEYKRAKKELKRIADSVKRLKPNDKPYQREQINNSAYFLSFNLSEYKKELLNEYSITLHPK